MILTYGLDPFSGVRSVGIGAMGLTGPMVLCYLWQAQGPTTEASPEGGIGFTRMGLDSYSPDHCTNRVIPSGRLPGRAEGEYSEVPNVRVHEIRCRRERRRHRQWTEYDPISVPHGGGKPEGSGGSPSREDSGACQILYGD